MLLSTLFNAIST